MSLLKKDFQLRFFIIRYSNIKYNIRVATLNQHADFGPLLF